MFVELAGTITIRKNNSKARCELVFHPTTWLENERYKVTGKIFGEDGKVAKSLSVIGMDFWEKAPLPPDAERMYNFSRFSTTLNQILSIQKDFLPCTDSRVRQDIRALEAADMRGAAIKKRLILERNNNNAKRTSNPSGGRRSFPKTFQPLWFGERLNCNGQTEWTFLGEYWNERKSKFANWRLPKLFDVSLDA
eukprot:CAMPEP_0115011984 /NCGR_PEP_ID=MMETSP0216-20121206/24417_1 /TAXON_ID=223996 /ORGANISM="Protocruzia adherens, Strain Boccale" /LENGTH=193 /DNA_ID=CAMNT_0002380855 /DNA_START=1 /DNA_END=583 /DNA_ORIENTATION=-